LSDVDFAMVARGLGCAGVSVSEPADLRDALAQALAAAGPTLVDVRTAVAEAAVPKFVEAERARALMQSAQTGRASGGAR
jgi:thiamine pyrophosphate-dependent acetolactate synthase large subunit-like protein